MSLRIAAVAALALTLVACATPQNDSVARAKSINDKGSPVVSKEASTFLAEAVDARLMDYEEGKLAAERGTTSTIRKYGELMMWDQTSLLNELRPLAASLQVSVPTTLSRTKAGVLEDLQGLNGEAFDKKFVRTIKIDHERDVKEFAAASEFADPAVKRFASERLPMIESHLAGIKAIAEQQ